MTSEPPHPTHTAFIGLGSNLGDREAALRRGLSMLDHTPGVSVSAVSRFINTTPVGGPEGQPDFLNAAARIQTSLSPRQLLSRVLVIEHICGRIRAERWGPRTLDLDILLFDRIIVNEPDLEIPHPLLHTRLFVLEPLAEIGPDVIHPVLNLSVKTLLERLAEAQ